MSDNKNILKRSLQFILTVLGFIVLFMFIYFILAAPFFVKNESDNTFLKNLGVVLSLPSSFVTGYLYSRFMQRLEKLDKIMFFIVLFLPFIMSFNLKGVLAGLAVCFLVLLGFLLRLSLEKIVTDTQGLIIAIAMLSLVFIAALINVNYFHEEKNDILIDAVKENNFNRFKLLVDSGVEVNRFDESYATPFMWAAVKGDLMMMVYLLENGADCNQNGVVSMDNYIRIYDSPLNAAAGEGHLEVVKYIVEECGVDINADVEGFNDVFLRPSDIYDVRGLYKFINESSEFRLKGIEFGKYDKNDKMLAHFLSVDINNAIREKQLYIKLGQRKKEKNKFQQLLENRKEVDVLLNKFVAPNRSNYEVFSENEKASPPLVTASFHGHFEIVKYLMGEGAKENKNNHGYSALNVSLLRGHFKIAKFLLEKGADPNITDDEFKYSAMIMLLMKDSSFMEKNQDEMLEMFKILVAEGADVNHKDLYGQPPLFYTCRSKSKALSEFLLKNSADLEIKIDGKKIRDFCKEKGVVLNFRKQPSTQIKKTP